MIRIDKETLKLTKFNCDLLINSDLDMRKTFFYLLMFFSLSLLLVIAVRDQ